MAGNLVYHWKHGWIPLTHAAALSKAHGSAKGAEKYVHGAAEHHGSLATKGLSAREIQARLDPHGRRPNAPDAGAATRIAQNEAAHPAGTRVAFREDPRERLQRGTVIGHSDRGVIVKRDAGGEEVTRLADDLRPVRGSETPRSVETLKDAELQTELRSADATRRVRARNEIQRREEARAAGSPRRGLNDYGTRHDNPTRLQEAAARRRLSVGDRVESEFGRGVVTEHTDRSVTYKLDSGESLNVQTGTPGYDRIKKVESGPHGLQEGDKVLATNVGASGDREARYVGLDINGKPQIRYAHGGQMVTTSVREDQIRPFNASAGGGPGLLGGRGGDYNALAAMARQSPEQRQRLSDAITRSNEAVKARHEAAYPVGSKVITHIGNHPAEVIGHSSAGVKVRFTESGRESFVSQDSIRPASDARQFGAAANAGQRANIRDAQSQARASALRSTKPQQGEMFGAHGEHQEDLFDQTPEPPKEVRASVQHSGDGTLLSIDRNDVEARSVAKSLGFKWSSNLGSWYLPRNWTESTRRQKVSQLQTRLGDTNVHVEDAGRGATSTAAEREAETRARAASRAERMDARSERLSAEADARFGRARQISDSIPLGQPILVGHHSEGRHRRDIARIDTNMRKGVEAHAESKAAEHSAENARRTAAGDDPLKRQRRIDRLEADVRAIDRELKDHELAGRLQASNPEKYAKVAHVIRRQDDARVTQLQARRAELVDQIEHDRGQIKAAGFEAPSAGKIEAGDIVHYRGRAHVVSKVNQKTVSVPTGYSWDDKVPINQITKHTPMADLSEGALKAAFTAAKNNPKVRARLLRELERRGVHVADL